MARRASSNAQAPHRGEVFSVDDGISEVEAEQIGRMQNFPQASTLRRRAMAPALSRVHSSRDDDEDVEQNESRLGGDPAEESTPIPTPAPIEDPIDEETTPEEDIGGGDDEDDDISDAESFTLKDRQQAINETHPFGIRLWKPALYKKDRSVQKNAEGDIHSSPGGRVSHWLLFFNIAWTLCFGWWLALIAFVAAVVCFLFAATRSGREYGQVLWGLAGYLLYPFGKFVRLEQQEPYIDEDEGEGRSISEYEQWQSGDLEAVGLKYWKYTIDGTNIFLINLMAVVLFVIFDWLVLDGVLHIENFITSPAFLFVAALFSIIPLAYFIGQAVASISAQSSMGLGAAINAFFSTIVEVFLYCVALNQGKGALVEGSIIGSIFAGILFLPGLSMCFGAIKRKTQRFNARSAGVTSTMLLFAMIGAFGPTLFYQIYGTHELNCLDCVNYGHPNQGFYLEAVRPYCYMAAAMLFLSYIIGLWFTLRTHAAVIWNTEIDEKKHEEHVAPRAAMHTGAEATGADIRDSHLYKRILGQSLRQVGLPPHSEDHSRREHTINTSLRGNGSVATPHVVPPKTDYMRGAVHFPGFTDAESDQFVHQVAEIAATAATVAARDARGLTRQTSTTGTVGAASISKGTIGSGSINHRPTPIRTATFHDHEEAAEAVAHSGAAHGGHDAPNWSRLKSAVILMGATILYAIIAEILVDTVDVVLEGFAIDEKFLGITLFALVPNTTEFLNAISFAMNGNIALSMEIGSAYALQVCLLQIPALVLFSAIYPMKLPSPDVDLAHYTFSLLFPQWDMVTVILCVFLLSYMYGEGKSNYFKGSILLLSYFVVVVGYYLSGYSEESDAVHGLSRFDTWGADGWQSYGVSDESFKTVGRRSTGMAF
ncbi:putative calcium permease protein [Phaeoacremonium minimum UCRPA7]|uniref:Putative calcium permease protein n=1 Tax=Phaeoacremonium minimum (strain UCR-PA7) TaxID=1286976 RepID=R8BBP3_PHAM7|nr:putative calcium permease protein [Phaeoacremonium minimum UCRPA7]EON96758.1 putative calcium permease protein [Phaeoacremonium minimum UCRPA7]